MTGSERDGTGCKKKLHQVEIERHEEKSIKKYSNVTFLRICEDCILSILAFSQFLLYVPCEVLAPVTNYCMTNKAFSLRSHETANWAVLCCRIFLLI